MLFLINANLRGFFFSHTYIVSQSSGARVEGVDSDVAPIQICETLKVLPVSADCMSEGLVLVKQVRPRAQGRYVQSGQWRADVQRVAEEEALREWAQKDVAPFEVVPPLKVQAWSGPALYVLGRGMYKQIKSIIP